MAAAADIQFLPALLSGPEQIRDYVTAARAMDEPVFFDIEATGFNPRQERLVSVQLKRGNHQPVVIDMRRLPQRAKLLAPLFDGSVLLVGHNIKFDLEWMRAQGVPITRASVFDTMIAEQVIRGGAGSDEDDDRRDRVDLKTVARRYGLSVSKEEREWFPGLDQRPDDWNAAFPVEQLGYMAQDVEVLAPIFQRQLATMQHAGLDGAFALEMDALPMIAEMESYGITIDLDGWRAFIQEKAAEARGYEEDALLFFGRHILDRRVAEFDEATAKWQAARDAEERWIEAQREIYDSIFEPKPSWGEYKKDELFARRQKHPIPPKPKLDLTPPNIGSADQLISAFEVLGIPVPTKKNAKGEIVPTTAAKELEKLAKADPHVETLVKFRKAEKFVDAFGETLLEQGEPTGLSLPNGHTLLSIHPDYNQIVSTGRMSCRKPNFQQIPSKGDGKRVRELVRARPGHKLISGDFSNGELRVLAHQAGRGALFTALASGEDVHSYTARMMFPEAKDYTEEQLRDKALGPIRGWSYRDVGKTINFGLMFGMSAFKLSNDFGIPLKQAEELMAAYFTALPEVQKYLDARAKQVHDTLESRTLSGRWRKYEHPGPEPSAPRQGKPSDYVAYQEKLRAWRKAWARIERQSKNTPIQGSLADITKRAIGLLRVRLEPSLEHLVAVVHDELVVETPEELADYTAEVLARAMEDAFKEFIDPALVPETEVKIADYWSHD